MADNQTPAHLKAEMPQIPGVSGPRRPARNPMLPMIVGLVVIGIILLFAVRWLSRTRPADPSRAEQTPQLEIPAPPPDPSTLLAHATDANPVIANIADLAKPWSSIDFFVRNRLTAESEIASPLKTFRQRSCGFLPALRLLLPATGRFPARLLTVPASSNTLPTSTSSVPTTVSPARIILSSEIRAAALSTIL